METTKEYTESTTCKRISYDVENKKLNVTFITGREYRYDNVPIEVWKLALQAESIGKFIAISIKGIYNYSVIS